MNNTYLVLPVSSSTTGGTQVAKQFSTANNIPILNIVRKRKLSFPFCKSFTIYCPAIGDLSKYYISSSHFILTHYSTIFWFFLLCLINLKIFKYSLFVQGYEWRYQLNPVLNYIFSAIYRFCFINGVYIFSTSHELFSNSCTDLGITFNSIESKFRHIPISVDPIYSTALDADLAKHFDLLFILRNGWMKNNGLYFSLLKKLSYCLGYRLNIVIVNCLNDKNFYQKAFYNLDCSITWLPPQSPEQLQRLYSLSKVFLYFSVLEGFGMPPFEAALSSSLPFMLQNIGSSHYLPPGYPYMYTSVDLGRLCFDLSSLLLNYPSEASIWSDKLKYYSQFYLTQINSIPITSFQSNV